MKRPHVAVLGLGRLGRACAEAILASDDVDLVGVVRRAESMPMPVSESLSGVPIFSHWSEIPSLDVALLCLPGHLILSVAHELLQHHKPIVECAQLHGDAFQQHRAKIHQIALRRRIPAVVGAGWDPGALSVFRILFQLLTPKGHTDTSNRPGVSLHHSASLRSVPGVKDALCAEVRSAAGNLQRYVYVEFESTADRDAVTEVIRSDPLFLGVETVVLPVDSVAALEEEGHGVVVERRGTAACTGHQLLLFEARFDRWALASEMMLAAARAVASLPPGSHSLLDIPLSVLIAIERRMAAAQEI